MVPSTSTKNRIPESLQAVFLASNRGQNVVEAPPDKVASRDFLRNSFRPRRIIRRLSNRISFSKITTGKMDMKKLSSHDDRAASTCGTAKAAVCGNRAVPRNRSIGTETTASEFSYQTSSPLSSSPSSIDSKEELPRKMSESSTSKALSGSPRRRVKRNTSGVSVGSSGRRVARTGSGTSTGSSSARKKKVIVPSFSPQMYLRSLMINRGYSVEQFDTLKTAYRMESTELQKASYSVYLIEAAKNDPEYFGSLLEAGLSPNPCNVYGESLLHTLCRRGDIEALQVMINCGCSLQVCDDYGRTPVHDALWNAKPMFEVVDLLLMSSPCGPSYMLSMKDVRGSTPLSYIRKEHWNEWIQFLESRKESYWPMLGDKAVPRILTEPPYSRSPPEPKEALTPEIAAMVATGKLTPSEACILMEDDGGTYSSECTSESDEGDSDEDFDSYDSDDSDDFSEDEDLLDELAAQGLLVNQLTKSA